MKTFFRPPIPLERAWSGNDRSKSGEAPQAARGPDHLCLKAAIGKGGAVHYTGEERKKVGQPNACPTA